MAKKSLLMLDQDAYYAGIYANRFESAGWKVWVEETLAGAIKRLKRVHPDVIIVDLEPLVESTGFIAGLRSDPKTAGTLIVGLAKLGDRKTLLKAQEAGVDSYLLKGHFVPSEAVKKSKTSLRRKHLYEKQQGFTLVELLVVIAIIALVVVFAALAVNAARSKQRDASRLANVRIVQSALEDYFNEANAYPMVSFCHWAT